MQANVRRQIGNIDTFSKSTISFDSSWLINQQCTNLKLQIIPSNNQRQRQRINSDRCSITVDYLFAFVVISVADGTKPTVISIKNVGMQTHFEQIILLQLI